MKYSNLNILIWVFVVATACLTASCNNDFFFEGEYPPVKTITILDDDGQEYDIEAVAGHVIVFFKDGSSQSNVKNLIEQHGGKIIEQMPEYDYYLLQVADGEENNFIAQMRQETTVEYTFLNTGESYTGNRIFTGFINDVKKAKKNEFVLFNNSLSAHNLIVEVEGDDESDELFDNFSPEKQISFQKLYENDLKGLATCFGKMERQGNTNFLITQSSGNNRMHRMEEIFNSLNTNTSEALLRHLIIVNAYDEKTNILYSNRTIKKDPLTTMVDISDDSASGTFFAATKLHDFIEQTHAKYIDIFSEKQNNGRESEFFLTAISVATKTNPRQAISDDHLERTVLALLNGVVFQKEPDVLVAGFDGRIATLWINGVAESLTDGRRDAAANSVFVDNNNMYVAGKDGRYATVWKNGVAQRLTDGRRDAAANCVFVKGNDVYVAGKEGNIAILWKNGDAQALTDGKSYDANASCVYVHKDDVYVTGWEFWYMTDDERGPGDSDYKTEVRLWKNGISQDLRGAAHANSIFVTAADDVYVAGNVADEVEHVLLWKNGLNQEIEVNSESWANSVFVHGNDVYIAGTEWSDSEESGIAVLWKNGQAQKLPNGVWASSVFISGYNLYVAGSRNSRTRQLACYWKNGEMQNLSDGTRNAYANSIFVVEK